MPSSALARSTFGTLLKQSKFSSFDPLISQVYTTHGGDAHRGHWGFKRPLPLRRRGAYITLKNVDTPEHQTEWNSAEPQALWVKNWDELKITPAPVEEWDSTVEHIIDSDYVPKTQSPEQWRQPYVPNLETMTRKEISDYLHKIRACRDSFLKRRTSDEQATSYQLSNQSRPSTQWHDVLAAHFSQRRRSNPRSREIEHVPHPSGGLSYAQYSPLQTFLMTKERKGRLADDTKGKDNNMICYVASFAGMAGRVQKKHAGSVRPVVWDDPSHTGEAMIRPQKVIVKNWPVVVGERQGLKAARVDMDLRVCESQSHHRSNPHWPGTAEYIAAEPPRSVQELTTQVAVSRAGLDKKKKKKKGLRRSTLSLLRSAMATSPDLVLEGDQYSDVL